MTQLLGIRGPAIYKIVDVPEADVAAAIDPDTGWAMEMTEGAVIHWDPNAPLNADWVIPGYYIPPELAGEPDEPPPEPPEPEVPVPLAIASISNSNPAGVTLANSAEISKFTEGDTVTIAGAVGDFAVCNGAHQISAVTAHLGGFLITGIDTSGAAAPATDPGMTVTPAAAPAGRSNSPPLGGRHAAATWNSRTRRWRAYRR